MKYLKKISNGIIIIITGLMHTKYALTAFKQQFAGFSRTYFFKISKGTEELPATEGITNFETFATFWFFYFGIFLIPLGLLVHSVERKKGLLPYSFTISYLIVALIGSYMVPDSGMTFFILPHALFMLVKYAVKSRKKGINPAK